MTNINTNFASFKDMCSVYSRIDKEHNLFVTNLLSMISTLDLVYNDSHIKLLSIFLTDINEYKYTLIDLYNYFKTNKISITEFENFINEPISSVSSIYNTIYTGIVNSSCIGDILHSSYFSKEKIKNNNFYIYPKTKESNYNCATKILALMKYITYKNSIIDNSDNQNIINEIINTHDLDVVKQKLISKNSTLLYGVKTTFEYDSKLVFIMNYKNTKIENLTIQDLLSSLYSNSDIPMLMKDLTNRVFSLYLIDLLSNQAVEFDFKNYIRGISIDKEITCDNFKANVFVEYLLQILNETNEMSEEILTFNTDMQKLKNIINLFYLHLPTNSNDGIDFIKGKGV